MATTPGLVPCLVGWRCVHRLPSRPGREERVMHPSIHSYGVHGHGTCGRRWTMRGWVGLLAGRTRPGGWRRIKPQRPPPPPGRPGKEYRDLDNVWGPASCLSLLSHLESGLHRPHVVDGVRERRMLHAAEEESMARAGRLIDSFDGSPRTPAHQPGACLVEGPSAAVDAQCCRWRCCCGSDCLKETSWESRGGACSGRLAVEQSKSGLGACAARQ